MSKVLIVDDSVFMRTVIRDMLQKDHSLEIVGTASNGIEALEKIRTLRPDLITLDIEMPRMNGLEVLRELKKAPWRPKTLMLSSLTSEGAEMTTEAIRLGADDFLLKPKDLPHSGSSRMNWLQPYTISRRIFSCRRNICPRSLKKTGVPNGLS